MVKAIEELDLASAALDEPEQALLGFWKQVIESGDVTDGVFERWSRHFTAREVIEALLAPGFSMQLNRLKLATRTPWQTGEDATRSRETASEEHETNGKQAG